RIEQCSPLGRRRCAGEAGAHATFGVCCQSELRDQQQTALYILQRAIHLARVIAEHPVIEQLVQGTSETGLIVLRLDADQRQQPLIDAAHHLAVDLYSCCADALDQQLHASSGGRSSRRRAICSAARISASVMPGSAAEWPASRMICNSLLG